MQATTIHQSPNLSVYNFRCIARPEDKPFVEVHRSHSLSCVRRGSFGCRTLGRQHELVAGAVLVGKPGREYMATHDHHDCGDECLSVMLSPELAESLANDSKAWDTPRLPPLPQLMVVGELWQAAAEGRSDAGADELALLLASKCVETVKGEKAVGVKATQRDRRRAVEAALWIEENAGEELSLEAAAKEAGISPFHFLRVFNKVLGVTPHQYTCWLPVVWIQLQQWREARDAASVAALSEVFHRRFRIWFALGVAAFAAVIAIYWLMVAKPLPVG